MTNQKTFDPYDLLNKFGGQGEKQLNDLIHLWTNNSEFARISGHSINTHARLQEMFNKTHELLANQLNLPTKNDLANLAQLSIQSEEKLDSLEEQIWKLQDSVSTSNQDIEGIAEVSNDITKLIKLLKTELSKTKAELAETKVLRSEMKEMKKELAEIVSLKAEISTFINFIDNKNMETSTEQNREQMIVNSK